LITLSITVAISILFRVILTRNISIGIDYILILIVGFNEIYWMAYKIPKKKKENLPEADVFYIQKSQLICIYLFIIFITLISFLGFSL
jgi:hypothetical protein